MKQPVKNHEQSFEPESNWSLNEMQPWKRRLLVGSFAAGSLCAVGGAALMLVPAEYERSEESRTEAIREDYTDEGALISLGGGVLLVASITGYSKYVDNRIQEQQESIR